MGSRGRGHLYQAQSFLCRFGILAGKECAESHIEVWAGLSMGKWHGRPEFMYEKMFLDIYVSWYISDSYATGFDIHRDMLGQKCE